MAGRVRLKLPRFNLTQRSTTGEVTFSSIPRGVGKSSCTSIKAEGETGDDPGDRRNDVCDNVVMHDLPMNDLPSTELPSMHEIAQKQAVESWAKMRPQLLNMAIQCDALPVDQRCLFCAEESLYRCLQCGPQVFYCRDCFEQAHNRTNLFHVGEVWDVENGVFRPLAWEKTIDVRDHECSSASFTRLWCITENGDEHTVLFGHCSCEPLVVTMIRARIWPSTPQRPHLAFTFELLDWAESLLLECQVSLNDFCKALFLKCRHLVAKRKEIYAALIDAFEEYRWMKVELHHGTCIDEKLDKGNLCPACPKESGTLVLSLDALFGLPRKKSAGTSHRDALHGDLFFCDQAAVDEYVVSYEMRTNKIPNACNNFLAGDVLRSSRRYHALAETAVFGSACRHEFPYLFLNLKHGERLSYAVWLLEEITQRTSEDTALFVMYDIACMLSKHLKASRNGAPLLDRVKLAVPSFHAFGHDFNCQVIYCACCDCTCCVEQVIFAPTRCEGLGLSDGEVMERMWSYLRRFSRMTKEMRPAHRIDILSHALLYYGLKTKRKLPLLLCTRWKRATEMKALAEETLLSLTKSLSVPVPDCVIDDWIKADKDCILNDGKQRFLTTEWKSSYFLVLQSFYTVRQQLNEGATEKFSTLRDRLCSLDSKLAGMERKFGISSRWKPHDKDYLAVQMGVLEERKNLTYLSLRSSVIKRHYLLQMKAKYADGQKIAKKLCTGITKEMKRIRNLLDRYNSATAELCSSDPTPSMSEVLSLNSEFWTGHTNLDMKGDNIPRQVKDELIQAYHMKKRSGEELELLKSDMTCTVEYWFHRVTVIAAHIDKLSDSQRGMKCVLQRLKWESELNLTRAVTMFSSYIELPVTVATTLTADANDDSDSEDEFITDDSDFEEDMF